MSSASRPRAAPPATSTRPRHRSCSARAPRTPRRCSSASSPATRRTSWGHPFVGPAGKLLDKALSDAGIDREQVYLTNVVKHFKWVARGKRRIHQKPNWSEVAACKPWFEGELGAVQPRVLVCLGATAAQALLGRQFRVSRERGVPVPSDLAEHVLATVHPSSILRGDPETREREYGALVSDLSVVAAWL